ncbi:hypothetical protein ZWY2020_000349 [Hordeum vulgare]|nr:hypothetical protein ZWY2020_000349 [Hordeum vulgare]
MAKKVDEEHNYYSDWADIAHGVDADGRATELRPLALSRPHTQAFHLAWLSLFACFFAAFAAPPILPALRPALVLAPSDASAAAVASLSAALVGRLAMGPACDLLGPRRASGAASLVCALALALAAVYASSPAGFVALRFCAGLSLSNFVANQHWMSRIFAPSGVGLANAVAAGWANVGSAAAQVVMPLAYDFIVLRLGVPITVAWRVAYLIPCAMLITTGLAVLAFPYDLPSGCAYGGGAKGGKGEGFWKVVRGGVCDYRAWVLALTYGYCYGVELIMENVAADFFRRRFRLPMEAAGAAAACFGVMNRWRGWRRGSVRRGGKALRMGATEAPSLAATMAVMVACGAFVQAASGLTFGIVPFVSKRSMGVVSGMTASGGAVGAIMTNRLFFNSSRYTVEESISFTGLTSLLCTLPVVLIYFPRSGGMLCGPSESDTDDHDGHDDDDDVNKDDGYMLLK